MKVLNFTIIKLTLCLIAGIIIAYYFTCAVVSSILLTLVSLIFLYLSYIISRKQLTKTIWFGLFSYLTMISIGILTVSLHNPANFKNHYTKVLRNDSLPVTAFRIREVLKPNTYYNKYIIDILEMNNQVVSGKTLLSIQKDSAHLNLNIDDVYIGKIEFQNISPPINPGQFNYKAYLYRKYIYHQTRAKHNELLKISSKTKTILGYADGFRNHINSKLKNYNFKPQELAIINALILGQRQNINEEIYTNYINAGAIHILAVSGLHVGIILLFLNFILKPIELLKHGKFYKTIILISLLWSFAIIAGLSASVTRAVTMFSIIAIAMNLKQPTNIFNTLALSMFLILLAKPLFLFDVGFQLSYLAVFAIVTIDPILYKLWSPKNKILNLYWHTLTVTLSAQIGIIPISLFYFHQFPGLFFISNLVIIPFLGFILGFGILVIILASLNILPNLLAIGFGNLISFINRFVAWIARQDDFIFTNIAFNLWQVLATYFLFISGFILLKKHNYQKTKLFLFGIIGLQLVFIYTACNSPNQEFVIFQKNRHTLISHTFNNKTTFTSDVDSLTQYNTIIKNYMVQNHITSFEKNTLKPVYLLNKKTLLVIDSLSIYNIKTFQPEYILLRESPKLNLNRLIDSIHPKTIIADGSNYKSYVKHWKAICTKRKLPFHNTSEMGAFIIQY